MSDPDVIASQPVSQVTSQIHIRYLRDEEEDCQFAGRLTVEAFRDIYVHATSVGSLPDIAVTLGREYRGQDPTFYQRNIIAEIDGHKAGLLVFELHGDPKMISGDRFSTVLGCGDLASMACLQKTLQTSVQKGHCLVHHLCVDKGYRRKGIGHALLKHIDEEVSRNECHTIYSWMSSRNSIGKHIYECNGYTVKDSITKCCCLWCAIGVWKAVMLEKCLVD